MTSVIDALNEIEAFRKAAFIPTQDPQAAQAAAAQQQAQAPPQQDPAMMAQMAAAAQQQQQPQGDPAAMAAQQQPQPQGGAVPGDPMEQLAPVLEQFMGALEETGSALQQLKAQLGQVTKENQSLQQTVMKTNAQVAMLEKAVMQPVGLTA
jgi:hypothetical protein